MYDTISSPAFFKMGRTATFLFAWIYILHLFLFEVQLDFGCEAGANSQYSRPLEICGGYIAIMKNNKFVIKMPKKDYLYSLNPKYDPSMLPKHFNFAVNSS